MSRRQHKSCREQSRKIGSIRAFFASNFGEAEEMGYGYESEKLGAMTMMKAEEMDSEGKY